MAAGTPGWSNTKQTQLMLAEIAVNYVLNLGESKTTWLTAQCSHLKVNMLYPKPVMLIAISTLACVCTALSNVSVQLWQQHMPGCRDTVVLFYGSIYSLHTLDRALIMMCKWCKWHYNCKDFWKLERFLQRIWRVTISIKLHLTIFLFCEIFRYKYQRYKYKLKQITL